MTVVDDTINGFLKDTNKQIEMVCQQIAEDPELQNGYNAIGFSQVCKQIRITSKNLT